MSLPSVTSLRSRLPGLPFELPYQFTLKLSNIVAYLSLCLFHIWNSVGPSSSSPPRPTTGIGGAEQGELEADVTPPPPSCPASSTCPFGAPLSAQFIYRPEYPAKETYLTPGKYAFWMWYVHKLSSLPSGPSSRRAHQLASHSFRALFLS